MTRVAVIAASSYPDGDNDGIPDGDPYTLKVQRQSSADAGASWANDGAAVVLYPGERGSFDVSPISRFHVSSDAPASMRGELRFGGSDNLRIVQQSWNGAGWSDYRVFDNPDSPWDMRLLGPNLYSYRVEAA